MIDLTGMDIVDDVGELPRVREVAVMEIKPHVRLMGVNIDMVYPLGVEGAGPPYESVDLIALR